MITMWQRKPNTLRWRDHVLSNDLMKSERLMQVNVLNLEIPYWWHRKRLLICLRSLHLNKENGVVHSRPKWKKLMVYTSCSEIRVIKRCFAVIIFLKIFINLKNLLFASKLSSTGRLSINLIVTVTIIITAETWRGIFVTKVKDDLLIHSTLDQAVDDTSLQKSC